MSVKPVSIPLKLRDRPLFKGLPVPAVVMYVNGVPDFRITDLEAWDRIANNRLCSLCGNSLRKLMWFIGGPSAMEQRLFFDLPGGVRSVRFQSMPLSGPGIEYL